MIYESLSINFSYSNRKRKRSNGYVATCRVGAFTIRTPSARSSIMSILQIDWIHISIHRWWQHIPSRQVMRIFSLLDRPYENTEKGKKRLLIFDSTVAHNTHTTHLSSCVPIQFLIFLSAFFSSSFKSDRFNIFELVSNITIFIIRRLEAGFHRDEWTRVCKWYGHRAHTERGYCTIVTQFHIRFSFTVSFLFLNPSISRWASFHFGTIFNMFAVRSLYPYGNDRAASTNGIHRNSRREKTYLRDYKYQKLVSSSSFKSSCCSLRARTNTRIVHQSRFYCARLVAISLRLRELNEHEN